MSESHPRPDDELARAKRIDDLCDAFEAAWLAGQEPRIHDYLRRAAEADRDALERELAPLDQHHRRRRDETAALTRALDPATGSPGEAGSRDDARRGRRSSSPSNSATADARLSFGRCEVLQEIARGGMGVVFRGRDADLRRDIAVKVLQERHRGEADLIRRFVEEAQISGQLQHPGITPVYELGEFPDGRPYFSMKLVRGETLAQLLAARTGPANDRERFLKIFEQVCQTLAYAHSRGVIHRDLKPSNIMVGAFGEVQVMDWGLAKVLASDVASRSRPADATTIQTARTDDAEASTSSGSYTQYGSVLGTLAYMPPEQALGEIDSLDRRADVFGLGAILCEILTGRPPYVADDFDQLRRKAIRADLADALASLDDCGADRELVDLARRALAPEPAARPVDAGVLARELTAHRESVENRLRQAELAEAQARARAEAERARRRLTLAFSVALLSVLAIGIIGTTWGLFQAVRATSAANEAKENYWQELYASDVQLAHQMWERDGGTAKNVAELLAAHLPEDGQADLREFAWRLQWTALHRNSLACKGHDDGAKLVACDPDGPLVSLDGTRVLRRWTVPEGTRLREILLAETSPILHWEISADGRRIALGSGRQIHLFDARSGDKTHVLPPRPAAALSLGVGFSPDGRHLACAWSDGRVQVWEAATGRESASSVVRQPDTFSQLERVELAPDGKRAFLLNYPLGNRITCLDFEQQTETLASTTHRSWVYCMAISADGRRRATGDSNGQVCLSEGEEHQELLRVHRGAVSAVAFSADGRRLATGGDDGAVTVRDVARHDQSITLKGHQGRVARVRFAADGATLASASDDGTVRVWDLRSADSTRTFGVHEQPVFSLAFSPDGSRLAIGTGRDSTASQGYVEIRDVATGKLTTRIPASSGRVLAVAYSPDGRRLITGGYDSRLSVRDAATGEELYARTAGDAEAPHSERNAVLGTLAVSPDGRFVAAGYGHPTFHRSDYEQAARVWDLATGAEVATLRGHANTICQVAFSRDGTLLATASDDSQIKLWSVATWRLQASLSGADRMKCVTFADDGRWIAAGDAAGVVTIWETAGGRIVRQLRGHADAVQRLVFSPDGRTLATASWDNTVKLWDPLSGRETRTIRDHDNWVSCLAFSPDGDTLATGSFDATTRLWKAASEREIAREIAEDRARSDGWAAKRHAERQARAARPHQAPPAERLDRYAGTYEQGLVVRRQADHLVIQSLPGAQGRSTAVYAADATEFFCRELPIDLSFVVGDDGVVKSVIIYKQDEAHEAKRLSDSASDGE